MEEGQKYNIVYSGDGNLSNCGFMVEAKFRSGTDGFKLSLPVDEVRKAITMSKSKDWVNFMAFKARPKEAKKTSEERKSVANYKQTRKSFEDDRNSLNDEIPF